MSKVDWNFFEYSAPAGADYDFNGVNSVDNPTEVSPGGGDRALKLVHGPWAGASPNPAMGYMYDGPDAGEFPLQDGQISFAIRTNSSIAQCTGVILRSQILLDGVISDPNDLNYYMFGVTLDATISDNRGSVALFRVVNGVPTHIAGTYLIYVVDNATDYIQIELRQVNDGANVNTYWRSNSGSQLTMPGDPGWGNFSLLDVDTSPGVLHNPGYWGFGVMQRNSGNYTSSGYYWDRISITQEIID